MWKRERGRKGAWDRESVGESKSVVERACGRE